MKTWEQKRRPSTMERIYREQDLGWQVLQTLSEKMNARPPQTHNTKAEEREMTQEQENKMSGPELKNIRQAAGLTQERLAYLVGVDIRTLRRWETSEAAVRKINRTAVLAVVTEEVENAR